MPRRERACGLSTASTWAWMMTTTEGSRSVLGATSILGPLHGSVLRAGEPLGIRLTSNCRYPLLALAVHAFEHLDVAVLRQPRVVEFLAFGRQRKMMDVFSHSVLFSCVLPQLERTVQLVVLCALVLIILCKPTTITF